ncbi:MAG: penicillin-binding protein [Flammeovirgaceae bacterium]
MGVKNSILVRIRVAFVAIVVVLGLVVVKMIDIQVVNGEKWREVARENGLQYRKVKATRGNILSDNGNFMATSLPFYQLAIDPTVANQEVFNANIDTLCRLFEGFFQEKTAEEYANEIREARDTRSRYFVVSRKRHVSYQERKELEKWPIFNLGRYRGGVLFEKVDKRFRPFDPVARRTVGFLIESDSTGELKGRGIEYSFNDELAGVDGEALYQRIAGSRWKPVEDESMVRTENGYDIETTINLDIQDKATEMLKKALMRRAAKYGVMILMEVETGEIKAMVNLGKDSKGRYRENYNYAVGSQGVNEPGSTFKTASMLALLEATDIKVNDTINTGDGKYMFYEDCIMTDAAVYGYGRLSVQKVFEKSSNIGVSKMVFRHFQDNPKLFYEYLSKFNLTKPIGFQMMGEGEPNVNQPGSEMWSGCSLPWMAIGYEVQVSPLHLVAFYNAIANGGKMIEPLLVKRVLRGGHIVEKEFSPRVLNPKICSERNLEIIQQMLEGVIEHGTANNIYTEEYKIAGKTGTTHKLYKGRYVDKYYTSFVGYFPADKPKYTCIVGIDEPQGDDHYGGSVAAPVFRELADWLYVVGVEKELDELEIANADAPYIRSGKYTDLVNLTDELGVKTVPMNTEDWVYTSNQGDTVLLKNNIFHDELVPDVTGMVLKDALYILENQGLTVKVIGTGARVRKQSLKVGRKVRPGYVIYLTMSS